MSAQRQALRVQMIGGPGVGKSSLIGALALLAETPSGGYFVTPIDGQSKRRFDDLRESFRQGRWPAKTSAPAPIHCRIHRQGRAVAIQLEDFAGESFLAAMQRGDDAEASQRIESLVQSADLLLVLIDGGKLASGETVRGLPLIQAIAQRLAAAPTAAAGRGVQAAVVVTKADLCQDPPLRTPQQVKRSVSRQVPDVAEFLRSQIEPVQWLPLSVCGYAQPCHRPPQAAAFSPAGFDRLFELFFSLGGQPLARPGKRIAAATAGLLLLAATLYHYRSGEVDAELQLIENPTVRLQDLPPSVAATNQAAYRERVREAALQASTDLRSARSEAEVEAILAPLERLPDPAARLADEELAALREQGQQRIEELLRARVLDAAAANDPELLQRAAQEYLKRYPGGPHAENARLLLAGEEEKRRGRAREQIESTVVWDAASLQRKIERITAYLQTWETSIAAGERAEIERAVAAARRMLRPAEYHVTLVRTAGLDRARAHGVQVKVGEVEVARFEDSGTVTEKTWNREFSLTWQLGRRIDVTLLNYRFRNSEIAAIQGRGPLAILTLAGTQRATRYGASFASSRPPVSVQFRCKELDEETVEAIESWIHPGNAW